MKSVEGKVRVQGSVIIMGLTIIGSKLVNYEVSASYFLEYRLSTTWGYRNKRNSQNVSVCWKILPAFSKVLQKKMNADSASASAKQKQNEISLCWGPLFCPHSEVWVRVPYFRALQSWKCQLPISTKTKASTSRLHYEIRSFPQDFLISDIWPTYQSWLFFIALRSICPVRIREWAEHRGYTKRWESSWIKNDVTLFARGSLHIEMTGSRFLVKKILVNCITKKSQFG